MALSIPSLLNPPPPPLSPNQILRGGAFDNLVRIKEDYYTCTPLSLYNP